MKKNPLFYSPSNANKSKIAFAKRKLFLSLAGIFAIFLMVAISTPSHSVGTALAATSLCFLVPFAAGVKGEGESDADFAARKGQAETAEACVKRTLTFINTKLDAIKDNPDLKNYKTELESLKTVVEGMKGDSTKLDKLVKEIEKANLAIESIKEAGVGKENFKSLREQVKAWITENKPAIDSIKARKKADIGAFQLKVNSPMTPSNSFSASTYLPMVEYVPGVTEIVRVQPTVWDYLTKGRTSSATLVWVNKYTPEGAADFIAPGAAKPGVSFKLQSEVSVAKKVAVSNKCATELLDDIDGMTTFIQQELQYQLRSHLNSAVMSGTASSTDINGLQTLSTTFTATGIETTDPNNWDAITACVAQLRSGNLTGPVTVFVNPIDYANMKMTKALSQGQLFIPANVGATIVEDNNVAVGYCLVAILDCYKIDILQDMQIMQGWEDDDFTKNLVTFICESRIHQRFSANHTGAFIYDTFANIKAAIAAV